MEGGATRPLPPVGQTAFVPADFVLAHAARRPSALLAAARPSPARARSIAGQAPPSLTHTAAAVGSGSYSAAGVSSAGVGSEAGGGRGGKNRGREDERDRFGSVTGGRGRAGDGVLGRTPPGSPQQVLPALGRTASGLASAGVAGGLLARGLRGRGADEAHVALQRALAASEGQPEALRQLVDDQAGLADAYLAELAALVSQEGETLRGLTRWQCVLWLRAVWGGMLVQLRWRKRRRTRER